MSHARIEEVSDSDPDMGSDPSEDDIDDFAESDIIRRVPTRPTASTASPSAQQQQEQLRQFQQFQQQQQQQSHAQMTSDNSKHANYLCIYPIYFDAARSRAAGRRVPAHLAVTNPLARDIVDACAELRLHTVFEPGKTHPKDWANPGRVRVKLGTSVSATGVVSTQAAGAAGAIANKHHLFILIARHLQQSPTADDSPALRTHIPGVPMPLPDASKPWPRPAVPRGWHKKMGQLLPAVSPAMTGGGVSENMFSDMMKGMQGGGGDAMKSLMASMGGGGAGDGPGGMPDLSSMGGLGALANMFGGGGGAGSMPALASEDAGGKKKKKKGKGRT